jgi:hypothetical protein
MFSAESYRDLALKCDGAILLLLQHCGLENTHFSDSYFASGILKSWNLVLRVESYCFITGLNQVTFQHRNRLAMEMKLLSQPNTKTRATLETGCSYGFIWPKFYEVVGHECWYVTATSHRQRGFRVVFTNILPATDFNLWNTETRGTCCSNVHLISNF